MDRCHCRIAFAPSCALAALALLAGTAAGQTDSTVRDSTPTVLEPLVVTAQPVARSAPVGSVPVPAAVVHRTQADNPWDLLRRTAGIEVHDKGQGPGFASDAVIRGFTSDHSSDVLLVLDGVPINLPVHGHIEGYADWSLLIPAAVERLEVIHGTSSAAHGDFALGGVVEVTTAADAPGTAAGLTGTSHGDVGGWLRTGLRGDEAGGLVAIDARRVDGWRENADYRLGIALLRGWRRVGPGRVNAGLLLYGSDWSSPGFVSVERYNAGLLRAAADTTDGGSGRRGIAYAEYRVPFRTARLDAHAWGHAARSRMFLTIPGEGLTHQTAEHDERTGGGVLVELHTENSRAGRLVVGVGGRLERARFHGYAAAARHWVADRQRYDATYLSGGAYLRWIRQLGEKLRLDTGLRADRLHYSRVSHEPADDREDAAAHIVVSPKLGLRYDWTRHAALFASVSRGFRGAIGVIADPSTPPFAAWTQEAGIETQTGRVHVRGAVFRVAVSNERTLDPVTLDVLSTGSSVRRGFDLQTGIGLVPGVQVLMNATVNHATVTGRRTDGGTPQVTLSRAAGAPPPHPPALHVMHDEPPAPGQPVPGVARYTARLGLEAARARARGALFVRVGGPYVPIGEPDVRTQPFAVVDAEGELPLSRSLTLDAAVHNVLNARYPELRASGYLNPGTLRTLRLAVRFTP